MSGALPTSQGPTSQSRTCALIVAGAGSSRSFVTRAFPPMVGMADVLHAIDDHRGSIERAAQLIEAAVIAARRRGERVLVGGVSFGAHASARWVTSTGDLSDVIGLLAVMPAWTGMPDAGDLAEAGAALRARGIPGTLDDLQARFGADWVVRELRSAWLAREEGDLLRELLAVARSPSVTPDELSRVAVPTVVGALLADPVHPVEVARAWARAIPRCELVLMDRHLPANDVGAIGRLLLARFGDLRAAGEG